MCTMPEQLQQPRKRTSGDRSFPWRCPRCLQKTVCPAVMTYRARASYDGRFYELDIPDLQIPKCSACGEMIFSNHTDEQITRALRAHLQLLSPEQIQEARHKL